MHESFNLKEAAKFLHMSAEGLRRLSNEQKVPGAKLGKQWVYIKEDLVTYVRSKYPDNWQISHATDSNFNNEESQLCVKEIKRGGQTSPHQMEKEYDDLLKRKTSNKH